MGCRNGKCGTNFNRFNLEKARQLEVQRQRRRKQMTEELKSQQTVSNDEPAPGTLHVSIASDTPPYAEFIMQFFTYDHLPEHLQAISKPFTALAEHIMTLPRNQEQTVALRFLLQAKDAAVRAKIAT